MVICEAKMLSAPHRTSWTLNHKAHSSQHRKNFQCPQAQNLQQPQNFQGSESFDTCDCYAEQICLRKAWDEKMEKLNDKYGLDYYSSFESASDWDEEELKYETLI